MLNSAVKIIIIKSIVFVDFFLLLFFEDDKLVNGGVMETRTSELSVFLIFAELTKKDLEFVEDALIFVADETEMKIVHWRLLDCANESVIRKEVYH